MQTALKWCLKSGAQALCSLSAILTNLLTPSAPVPRNFSEPQKPHIYHPLLYLIWSRIYFKVLLRWPNPNLLRMATTLRGLMHRMLEGCVWLWAARWTWKGIVLVPRLHLSQSGCCWCGAGGSCFQCRKSFSHFMSHYSSVLILFLRSGSFLAHGLSHWPPLIQPPSPLQRAGWAASWLPGLMHH